MPKQTGQGKTLEGYHEILGGIAHIYQVKQSKDVWQFRMWFLLLIILQGLTHY